MPVPTPDFRALFESAPGLMLVLTPALTIVAVSETYLRATMTKREEILGRDLFEVFPDNPADLAATGVSNLRSSLERVLENRVADAMAMQKYDIRRPESEGSGFEVRYWSPSNFPVLGPKGEILYIIHRVEDVTEYIRQRNETAQLTSRSERATKNFLESLVQHVPLMIFVKEARELRFVKLNKAGEDLLGYPEKELLGKNDYDFFTKEEADWFIKDDRRVLEDKKMLLIEEESIRIKNGEERILRTRKVPLFDADDTPQYLLGISEDITEFKKVKDTFRDIDQRFRLLVDGVQDYAIFMLDPTGTVISWNKGAQRISGYETEEVMGKHFSIFCTPEDQATGKPDKELKTALDQGRVEDEGYRVRKNGQRYWSNVIMTPVFGENKKLRGFAKVTRDMTERKEIEKELQEKNEQLQNAAEVKDQFLANMSHELRTPLNGIIGFAEFLVDGKPGAINSKQKEYLGDILNSGKHLLQLISDLLDLAKVGAGKMEFYPERFSLRKAIQETCSISDPIAQKRGIHIDVAVAPEIGDVTLDQQKFKQVLFNLLSNAIKFSHDGGKVGIRVEPYDTDRIKLVVSDAGIGITTKDVGRLFNEFEQLESGASRRHEGTGLGLALTRKILEAQGGEVSVESEVGKGSSFTVILPINVA